MINIYNYFKHRFIYLFVFILFSPVLYAQVTLKDAYKAVVQVVSYDAEGNVVNMGNGFCVSSNGCFVAPYFIFTKVKSAFIIDYKVNKYQVDRILGANSNYDLVKFTVSDCKDFPWMNLPDSLEVSMGSSVHCIKYSTKKKNFSVSAELSKLEDYHSYKYFTLNLNNAENLVGCPVLNDKGYAFAIVQKNFVGDSTTCAIDSRFVGDMFISVKSSIDADLLKIEIPKALPNHETDALTYMYMLSTKDSLQLMSAYNDFIKLYPKNPEIYVLRAGYYAARGNYKECSNDFTIAEGLSENDSLYSKDKVLYAFSKLMFNTIAQNRGDSICDWSYSRAYHLAEKAYQINSNVHYLIQQAHCLFYMKSFDLAYQKYFQVCQEVKNQESKDWSDKAQIENWFYAARSLELSGGDPKEVLSLFDELINLLQQPKNVEDARYYLERAQRLMHLGEYRKAISDYNIYEQVVGPMNLTDKFYYLREQAEMNCGMYQQALDDIRTAMSKNPDDPFYPIEEAVIYLRVGMFDEAISICKSYLEKIPENPDCYKIIGIAYGEKGKKKDALQALKKAKSLGDENVDYFIEKYE